MWLALLAHALLPRSAFYLTVAAYTTRIYRSSRIYLLSITTNTY